MSSVMFMVGETSGDTLAVELLEAMREAGQEVEPFGAGGPKMKSSGVELEIDLTEHAVIGIWEAVRNYGKFKGFFDQLLQLALDGKPDAVILLIIPGSTCGLCAPCARPRRAGIGGRRLFITSARNSGLGMRAACIKLPRM